MHLGERRSFPRLRADVPVVAVVARSRLLTSGTRVPGRLVDISVVGMSFSPSAPLQPGDMVRVAFGGAGAADVPEAIVIRLTGAPDGTVLCACRFTEQQCGLVEHVAQGSDGA